MNHYTAGIFDIPRPIGGRIRAFLADRRRSTLEALARERGYRQAVFELSSYSDRELADMGIARCDIRRLVRENPNPKTTR